jgi:hypothetical protein
VSVQLDKQVSVCRPDPDSSPRDDRTGRRVAVWDHGLALPAPDEEPDEE